MIFWSSYVLCGFGFSTLLWVSQTRTDDHPFRFQIALVVVSVPVYLPTWCAWLSGSAFGLILMLVGTLLLLFWKHRNELAEVTWEDPGSGDIPAKPAEPEEFYGRGTV